MEIQTKQALEDAIKSITKNTVMEAFAEFRKEQEAATKAAPAWAQGTAPVVVLSPEERTAEKGMMLARIVRTKAAIRAGLTDSAQKYADEAVAKAAWSKDVADNVVKALGTTSQGAGGAIVPPGYSTEIIELLYNRVAVRKLGASIIPMELGNITIPKMTGGVTGSYIGENAGDNAQEPTFGVITLSFKKLRASVPMSNDLLRFSNPKADELVRNDIVNALAVAEDVTFLRSPGSSVAPKGLTAWMNNSMKGDMTADPDLQKVTSDLFSLLLKLEEHNVPMIRPGWIFAPRTKYFLMSLRDGLGNYVFKDEMLRGTLLGYPFVATNSVPVNLGTPGANESEVIFGDFVDAVIGESSELMLDTSQEAAYLDGTGTLVSAWALDQTVVRAIARHDFNVRRDFSFAMLEKVTWGVPAAPGGGA